MRKEGNASEREFLGKVGVFLCLVSRIKRKVNDKENNLPSFDLHPLSIRL